MSKNPFYICEEQTTRFWSDHRTNKEYVSFFFFKENFV